MPTLLGQRRSQKTHRFLYWEFHESGSKQAVRAGNWKAVRLAPSKPIELYDLDADLGETRDIARDYPHIVAKMKTILLEARTGAGRWPLLDIAETTLS